jgi:uncharacterized protein YraI
VTVRTDKQGGSPRQVFTPSREEPVAIFLPQHRPGRLRGPSLPVVAAAIGTVLALGAGFVYMLPSAPQAASAETLAAAEPAPLRSEAPAAARGPAADTVVEAAASPPEPQGEPVRATEPQGEPVRATEAPAAGPAVVAAVDGEPSAAADIPAGDDPRWARAEAAPGGAALQAVKKLVIEKAARSEDAGPDVLAYAAPGAATDPQETAATVQRPLQIVLPEEPPAPPSAAAVREVTVRSAVNMRSGPGSNNRVILVIPRRAKVELHGCDQWCKVGYDGRIGYIYKSFVPGQGGSARATSPSRSSAEPAKTVAVVSTVEQPDANAPAAPDRTLERQRDSR